MQSCSYFLREVYSSHIVDMVFIVAVNVLCMCVCCVSYVLCIVSLGFVLSVIWLVLLVLLPNVMFYRLQFVMVC